MRKHKSLRSIERVADRAHLGRCFVEVAIRESRRLSKLVVLPMLLMACMQSRSCPAFSASQLLSLVVGATGVTGGVLLATVVWRVGCSCRGASSNGGCGSGLLQVPC